MLYIHIHVYHARSTICMQHHALLFCFSYSAEIWLTRGDETKKLSREPDVSGQPGPIGGFTVNVDRGQVFQSIKGFGAALSNAAAYLLAYSYERENVLNELFGSSGIGLSYVRLVMGGSDFNAVWPYTYDDASYEDFNMNEFSINKDLDFVIPVLKDILRINPSVRIMASPWSAPAWMKDNGSLNGGSLKSGAAYLQALAEYFVRFVKAYQSQGITIDTITLQNEPEHATSGYPTMAMPWNVQRDLIRDYLGPLFRQEGITTEIIIWDHNWDATWYPINILADAGANQYIAGTAWHCYAGNRYDPLDVQAWYPDKDVYFTECSGGQWDTNFGSTLGWNTQNLFIGQTRIGARTVLLWNLALDENYGPRVGANGCSDCRGVVRIQSSLNVPHVKNVEFYVLGHFSKFVPPGSRRIMSTTFEGDDLETVAYQKPDGKVVVVVTNLSWNAGKTFQILVNGNYYYYDNLPTRSVLTFVEN